MTVMLLGLLGLSDVIAAERAADFALQRFDGKGTVKLSDFAGKVVVLDFFAYWCSPCARSSPLVEEQVQKYYASKQGNPHGIPVQVVSINVESNDVKQTKAFIEKHRVDLVLNDRDGETLKALGGKGLPYFVVIDGTQGTPDQPIFKVVYARAGFEGAEKLRSLIDRLGARQP